VLVGTGQAQDGQRSVMATAVAAAAMAALEIRVTGFRQAEGQLAIALFATAADYESQTNAVRRDWLEVRDGESVWAVEGIRPGRYAVIAYHDENGNEAIDQRILGLPKEPVGVSNNARGMFGPPGFRAASFAIVAPLTRHEIALR
jgi:uncharacterized protein (DUF2141 family)